MGHWNRVESPVPGSSGCMSPTGRHNKNVDDVCEHYICKSLLTVGFNRTDEE